MPARHIPVVILFVFFQGASCVSFGQGLTPDLRPPAWAVSRRPPDSPLRVHQFDRIYASLVETGRVRLIVGLREPASLGARFAADAKLENDEDVLLQRIAISRQQEVILRQLSFPSAANAKRYQFIPFMALEANAADFFSLLASPEVDFMQEDVAVPPSLMQSVPLIGARGDGTFSGYSGAGMTVAILDTGVDATHPFVNGKVVSEACYSSNYQGSSVSVCPNAQTPISG